jgi:GLPGLI family protein
MKRLFTFFICLALFGLCSFTGGNHTKFEVIITYGVTFSNAQSTTEGGTFTVYFKGNLIKTVGDNASCIATIITDREKPWAPITMQDILGHKFYIKSNDKDIAENKKYYDKHAGHHNKIVYVDGTKVIAGYTCHKALVTCEDSTVSAVYYSDQLPNYEGISGDYKDLDGFPLEYAVNMGPNATTTFSVKSVVKESLPDSTFQPSADYKVVTSEEFSKEMKDITGGGEN